VETWIVLTLQAMREQMFDAITYFANEEQGLMLVCLKRAKKNLDSVIERMEKST